MSDLNVVSLSGRLTREPELKVVGSNNILEFSLASNERYKDDEKTTFMDCTMFGDRGSKLVEFLEKGKHLTVVGKLRQENWEKDGQKRSKIGLIVNEIIFTPGNKE